MGVALPKLPFGRYITSKQLVSGNDMNGLFDLLTSYSTITTTGNGATLANAIPVNFANIKLVVNTAGDAIILPPANPGVHISIDNTSANAAIVWPFQSNPNNSNTADNIDGLTSSTHFSNSTLIYDCTVTGIWNRAVTVGSVNPSTEITQFGSGTATFLEEGNVYRNVIGAGSNPGGTGSDYVLAAYSLPANSLDGLAGTNRGLNIMALGSFGANGDNKTIKLIWGCTTAVVGSAVTGGTTVATTGVVTTNGGGWSIQADVYKYGAAGSNTQIGLHQQSQVGSAVTALQAPTLLTSAENAAILIAVTGNAGTVVGDIVYNFSAINALN